MARNSAVEAICISPADAEASIKVLRRSGFDMKKLSIAGKDYRTEDHVVDLVHKGEQHALCLLFNVGTDTIDFDLPHTLPQDRWHLADDASRAAAPVEARSC